MPTLPAGREEAESGELWRRLLRYQDYGYLVGASHVPQEGGKTAAAGVSDGRVVRSLHAGDAEDEGIAEGCAYGIIGRVVRNFE